MLCATCSTRWPDVASTVLDSITVHAAGRYEGVLRELVHGKLHGNRVASVQLARLIAQQTLVRDIAIDCIVPIPLHWTRTLHRGFNQSRVMAKVLGRLLGVPVHNALRRTRRTAFQSSLSKTERTKNVRNAMVPTRSAHKLAGKNVLLVDDLLTTGATLQSAAKVLRSCKPAGITAVVGAKV